MHLVCNELNNTTLKINAKIKDKAAINAMIMNSMVLAEHCSV